MGAGAAGMMCAAVAGRRGRRVLLVDHSAKLGEKIRISGGGRCNFTNLHTRPEAFLSRNPHFCRSALARYTPRDFIALVERHGIRYHEKTLGQLFCDESATQIIAMLKERVRRGGRALGPPGDGGAESRWRRATVTTSPLRGRDVAGQLPHALTRHCHRAAFRFRRPARPLSATVSPSSSACPSSPPKPALVPLARRPEWLARFGELSGTSFEASASCEAAPGDPDRPRFEKSALITHRGLSGTGDPAGIVVLAARGRARAGRARSPARSATPSAWLAAHRHDPRALGTLLEEFLPRRFAQSFAKAHGWTQPLAQLSNAAIETIAQTLKGWRIQPSGTLGYAKAEVTLGGVDTDALSQQTMEARAVPGLYFIGEVVDVTGWLGGYNFQWAWSSGYAAGSAV